MQLVQAVDMWLVENPETNDAENLTAAADSLGT